MSRISRKTVTSSVVDVLREKIVSHEIPAGAPLRQDALAAELSVKCLREHILTTGSELARAIKSIAHEDAK